LSRWLLTNKAILEQGLKQFLANATCSAEPSAEAKSAPLVDMSTANRYRLQCRPCRPYDDFWIADRWALHEQIDLLPNFKVLGLNMTLNVDDPQCIGRDRPRRSRRNKPWKIVDIPGFGVHQPQIRKLEIRLEVNGPFALQRHIEVIRAAFAAEVTRIGEELPGKGGSIKVSTQAAVWQNEQSATALEPYVLKATYTKG